MTMNSPDPEFGPDERVWWGDVLVKIWPTTEGFYFYNDQYRIEASPGNPAWPTREQLRRESPLIQLARVAE